MAQAILASLLASAMATTLVGRRANDPVSQDRCRWLVPKQNSSGGVRTSLAISASKATAGVLAVIRYAKIDGIPSRSEGSWVSNAGDKRRGQRRTDARDRVQPPARRVLLDARPCCVCRTPIFGPSVPAIDCREQQAAERLLWVIRTDLAASLPFPVYLTYDWKKCRAWSARAIAGLMHRIESILVRIMRFRRHRQATLMARSDCLEAPR